MSNYDNENYPSNKFLELGLIKFNGPFFNEWDTTFINKTDKKITNMKAFDLEAAKRGETVCTRNGLDVRILCFDCDNTCPIVALVKTYNREAVYTYTSNGRNFTTMEPEWDLMLKDNIQKTSENFYIRGVSKRGKEVIKLLESKGGKNIKNLYGNDDSLFYCINAQHIISTLDDNELHILRNYDENFIELFLPKTVISYKKIFFDNDFKCGYSILENENRASACLVVDKQAKKVSVEYLAIESDYQCQGFEESILSECEKLAKEFRAEKITVLAKKDTYYYNLFKENDYIDISKNQSSIYRLLEKVF